MSNNVRSVEVECMCFTKSAFFKNKLVEPANHLREVSLKKSKRIFDSDKV